MNEKEYKELKPKILEALSKLDEKAFPGEKSVTLVDGFATISLTDRLGQIQLGGRTIPSIALVGDTTGKIYLIGLKRLIPEIELSGDKKKGGEDGGA